MGPEAALAPEVIAALSAETAIGGGSLLGSAGLEAGLGATLANTGFAASIPSFLKDNALSLGLHGAGAGLKYIAGADANDRRKKISDSLLSYQKTQTPKSLKAAGDFVEENTPEGRARALSAEQANLSNEYGESIGASMALDPSRPVSGKLSQGYIASDAAAADKNSARLKKIIESLSVMRAPGEAGQKFARNYGRAAGGVDAANMNMSEAARAASGDIAGVQPSPWMTAGADALSGIGQGLMLKKAKAATGGVF